VVVLGFLFFFVLFVAFASFAVVVFFADDHGIDDPFEARRAPLSRRACTAAAVTCADADARSAELGTQGSGELGGKRREEEEKGSPPFPPLPSLPHAPPPESLPARELASAISASRATAEPPASAPVTNDERCLRLEA